MTTGQKIFIAILIAVGVYGEFAHKKDDTFYDCDADKRGVHCVAVEE